MSAGLLNLGMGADFMPIRQESTAIVDPNFAGQMAAAQQAAAQQQAAIQRPQDPNDFLNGLQGKQAQWQVDDFNKQAEGIGLDYRMNFADTLAGLQKNVAPHAQNGTLNQVSNIFAPEYASEYEAYAGNRNPGWAGYGHDGAYQGQAAAANQQSQAAALAAAQEQERIRSEQAAFQANQNTQQDAYNKQTGGGFAGGILNGSYAKPFSDQIGQGQTGISASSPMITGTGSAAAPSTGLAPTGPAAATGAPGTPPGFGRAPGTPQEAKAWGGVFSNKNPWSLA